MAYGPDTSKKNKLPHGFWEELYTLIPELEDLQHRLTEGSGLAESDPELISSITQKLKRQRQSHLGMEEL